MYWLFDEQTQQKVREDIDNLFHNLLEVKSNPQHYKESMFPFSGRKCHKVGSSIIESLSEENDVVFDPFLGSGSFMISSQYNNRKFIASELDPYMAFLQNTIFQNAYSINELESTLTYLENMVSDVINDVYSTYCTCGERNLIKAVYFDFSTNEYINPVKHERINDPNKNVVFLNQCSNCNEKRKQFDLDDLNKLNSINLDDLNKLNSINLDDLNKLNSINLDYSHIIKNFPDHELVINSRINITRGKSDHYNYFFTDRQKLVLLSIWEAILTIPDDNLQKFFQAIFLANLSMSKITDYRTQSQDLYYIPGYKNKEQNIWYQFKQRFSKFLKGFKHILATTNSITPKELDAFIDKNQKYKLFDNFSDLNELINAPISKGIFFEEGDYKSITYNLNNNSIDFIFTDPPYRDQVPYLERSQLFYPWLNIDLASRNDLLDEEIVVSNSPIRSSKNLDNYWNDIETFMKNMYKVLKPHKYMALYFQPSAGAGWLTDLNKLKLIARKHGFEPLQTFDLAQKKDPSKRKIASATWSFSKEILIIFIKLEEKERYWFIEDNNIDKLVYKSICDSLLNDINFDMSDFYSNFRENLKEFDLIYNPSDKDKLNNSLNHYARILGNKGIYKEDVLPPFTDMIRQTDIEIRIFDYTPVVIDELFKKYPQGFSYADFLLRLSFYLDNGEKEVISILEQAGSDSKIRSEIGAYVVEDSTSNKLVRKSPPILSSYENQSGRIDLNTLDGIGFELLMQDYLIHKGFTNVHSTKYSDDRGVDIFASLDDETYVIQCKRWKKNNPVSATPIQRIDSFRNSRKIDKAYVITTSYYTPSAIAEARITQVSLIDGKEIRDLLEEVYPGKYK